MRKIKEAITDLAVASGYDGDEPKSIAQAIDTLAGVSGGGSGSGGDAGYDVTKVQVVAEQTITTEAHTHMLTPDRSITVYLADIDVAGDLAQMFADGKVDVTCIIDDVAQSGEIGPVGNNEYGMYFTPTLYIGPNQTNDGYVMQFPDTAPTTHTVSVYCEDVTTTEHFDKAVVSAVTPKKIGALEYMGAIYVSTNSNMSITINANSMGNFDLSKNGFNADFIDYNDDELLERYGEDYESMVSARVITGISQPALILTDFDAYTPSISLFNNKSEAVTIDGSLNQISISIALFG